MSTSESNAQATNPGAPQPQELATRISATDDLEMAQGWATELYNTHERWRVVETICDLLERAERAERELLACHAVSGADTSGVHRYEHVGHGGALQAVKELRNDYDEELAAMSDHAHAKVLSEHPVADHDAQPRSCQTEDERRLRDEAYDTNAELDRCRSVAEELAEKADAYLEADGSRGPFDLFELVKARDELNAALERYQQERGEG